MQERAKSVTIKNRRLREGMTFHELISAIETEMLGFKFHYAGIALVKRAQPKSHLAVLMGNEKVQLDVMMIGGPGKPGEADDAFPLMTLMAMSDAILHTIDQVRKDAVPMGEMDLRFLKCFSQALDEQIKNVEGKVKG